jgi:motility quorum-sensing regulator/GCU-specific mRNA interferase toxin
MEKRKAHYDLTAVKTLIARDGIQSFTATYADHRLWQDVYHALCPNEKTAYIKITMRDGATVVQFREK